MEAGAGAGAGAEGWGRVALFSTTVECVICSVNLIAKRFFRCDSVNLPHV